MRSDDASASQARESASAAPRAGTISAPRSRARFVDEPAKDAGMAQTLRTPAAVRRMCCVSLGKTASDVSPVAASVSRSASPANENMSGVITRLSDGSRMCHS
jgi:hypothetical protein